MIAMTKLRVLALLLALCTVAGCAPVPAPSGESTPPSGVTPKVAPNFISDNFQEIAHDLQQLYYDRNVEAYRSAMIVFLNEMSLESTDTISDRTEDLLSYAGDHGADGLEPLILAYLDTVARAGTNSQKTEIMVNIALANKPGGWFAQAPAMNIAMPLGRASTPTIVDVRADAIRLLAESAIRGPQILTLEELLSNSEMQAAMCRLPSIAFSGGDVPPGQSGLPGTGGSLPQMETARRANCENNNGTAAQALQGIALTACLNTSTEDQARMAQTIADAYACANSSPDPEDRRPSPPELAPALVVAARVLAAVDITFSIFQGIEWAEKKIVDKILEKDREWGKAVEEAHTATKELMAADKELQDAKSNLEKANGALSTAQGKYEETLNEFTTALNSGTATEAQLKDLATKSTTAEAERDKAQRAVDAAKVAESEAKATKEQKEAEARAATEKAEEKRKAATIPAPGSEEQATSAACERLMGLPELEKLRGQSTPEEMREWLRRIVSFPSPDDPGEFGFSDMQYCGLDDNTVNNKGGACSFLIVCEPGTNPNKFCQCVQQGEEDSRQALLQSSMACLAINCPPDSTATPKGALCMCKELGADFGSQQPRTPPQLDTSFFGRLYLEEVSPVVGPPSIPVKPDKFPYFDKMLEDAVLLGSIK